MKVETGTGGMNDVDISWIPLETLNVMSMFSLRPLANIQNNSQKDFQSKGMFSGYM